MRVIQIDHKYEMKIDLGNYQSGTVEFYALADLAPETDPDAARRALQGMASRNMRVYATQLKGGTVPQEALGLNHPGLTVTKLGVGYGKKLKLNGHGTTNREINHRVWGQLEADDDPAVCAQTLWSLAIRAYDEKMAGVQPDVAAEPAQITAEPEPGRNPAQIKARLTGWTDSYRGRKRAPSDRQRTAAEKVLERAIAARLAGDPVRQGVETAVYLAEILDDLFGRRTIFDLEARHCSAIMKWSKDRPAFGAEVARLMEAISLGPADTAFA